MCIYIVLNFIRIVSGVQKLLGGKSQTHREHSDLVRILLHIQERESRLKKIMSDLNVLSEGGNKGKNNTKN
jgi:hypothetical protein